MTQEQINKINKAVPYEQGIYKEPWGIPVHIKEPVIYMRHETGGYSGGSCWDTGDDDGAQPYTNHEPIPKFEVLDKVLELLKPNITYLQYREVERLIHDNYETQYEYYGNSTDYVVKYIKLSELEELLNKMDIIS
jgi:hypothetical protein